jgi:hypothetical protein
VLAYIAHRALRKARKLTAAILGIIALVIILIHDIIEPGEGP